MTESGQTKRNSEDRFSTLCKDLGFSQGMLLVRSSTGALEVSKRHGLRIDSPAVLKWAEAWCEEHATPALLSSKQMTGASWSAGQLAAHPLHLDGETFGHLFVEARKGALNGAGQSLARTLTLEVEAARLHDRLARLSRVAALGELVYHVAHEINNPLTTVVGYAELLADRTASSAVKPMISRLKDEAERALGIARNVLGLTHDREEKQPCHLNAILLRALALRQYALEVAGIKVETDLHPGLSPVEGVPGKMQQAFLNIIINAEQALEGSSRKGSGLLRLWSTPVGSDSVEICISNNGPAIPSRLLEKIFDSFYTSKPPGVGTGLGLAIARAAVEAAGGDIHAENCHPGVLFRIRLPVVPLLEETAASSSSETGGKSLLAGRRLLVVEDEAPISQLIQDVFRGEGCLLTCCGTAEEAAAVLRGHQFDGLLSDLKLPGLGGQWLFDHLRKANPSLSRRVLFITGDTVSKSTVAFLERTGRPVLSKPFHVAELKSAVEDLLNANEVAVTK